jgi:hypothetical protein
MRWEIFGREDIKEVTLLYILYEKGTGDLKKGGRNVEN